MFKNAKYAKRLPAQLAFAAALTGDPDPHASVRNLDLLKILQGMQCLVTRSKKRRVQRNTCTWRRRQELHGWGQVMRELMPAFWRDAVIGSRRAKKIVVKCMQHALHNWEQVGSPQGQANETLQVFLGEARVFS